MKTLVLFRDLPSDYIRLIDVKIERVEKEAELTIPTAKECGMSTTHFNKLYLFTWYLESDEEVEDLVVGHVQTALEHAYPNALNFETIVE